jgi:hypothetical protein
MMTEEELVRKPLYHITDWRNLPSIIQGGGLWCKRELDARKLSFRSAAHEHINERRKQTSVTAGAGGVLSDYVAWSFGRRSPMLCAIANGRVHDSQQKDIVHLVSYLHEFIERDCQWAFCDGHPVVSLSKYYDHISQLSVIDWPLMQKKWWHNTEDDPDRARRRQAEFLVSDFVPWPVVRGIGVVDEEIAAQVAAILAPSQTPPIKVVADWYYL